VREWVRHRHVMLLLLILPLGTNERIDLAIPLVSASLLLFTKLTDTAYS